MKAHRPTADDSSIAFGLEAYRSRTQRHNPPYATPGYICFRIHDVTQHHRQRQATGILAGHEPHQALIDIFADQRAYPCLVRDIQPLAFARQIDVLVVTNGQDEVDIARCLYVAARIFREQRVLIDDPPRHQLRSDQ